MRENSINCKYARPCTITSVSEDGWSALNACMYKKDGLHAYVFDPNGGLPEIDATYILSVRNRQHTFMYSVVPEEAFAFDKGSLCLCRIECTEPTAMKFFSKLKETEVMTGSISDVLRGVPGCGVKI